MRILIIRRDNIGDLVCTTPLLAALRGRFPNGWIGALVNSYNAPVLDRNPDVNAVIAYRKLKHLAAGESALGALGERLGQLWRLRRMKLDCVVLAAPGLATRALSLARWLKPRRIAGFSDGSRETERLDMKVPLASTRGAHEVEQVFALARLFGVEGGIPPLKLVPDAGEVARARSAFSGPPGPRVAVHVSARRSAQRWPASRCADLIRRIHADYGSACVLLWSPGPAHHPQHPGDDAKAAEIVSQIGGKVPVFPYPTATLPALIGALAACDRVICSDGGAMHLAAALGKPIVALFGDSPVEHWRPWGVSHRVVRPESRNLADLPVEAVLDSYSELERALQPG